MSSLDASERFLPKRDFLRSDLYYIKDKQDREGNLKSLEDYKHSQSVGKAIYGENFFNSRFLRFSINPQRESKRGSLLTGSKPELVSALDAPDFSFLDHQLQPFTVSKNGYLSILLRKYMFLKVGENVHGITDREASRYKSLEFFDEKSLLIVTDSKKLKSIDLETLKMSSFELEYDYNSLSFLSSDEKDTAISDPNGNVFILDHRSDEIHFKNRTSDFFSLIITRRRIHSFFKIENPFRGGYKYSKNDYRLYCLGDSELDVFDTRNNRDVLYRKTHLLDGSGITIMGDRRVAICGINKSEDQGQLIVYDLERKNKTRITNLNNEPKSILSNPNSSESIIISYKGYACSEIINFNKKVVLGKFDMNSSSLIGGISKDKIYFVSDESEKIE